MSGQTLQPLWQLPLKSRNTSESVALSCDDCFLILEYLADTHQEMGADIDFLRTIASKHLSCCPDCRQYYLQRLEQLEQMQQTSEANSEN